MITLENALLWGTIYGGVVVAVAWIAMVFWTFRDMRARSRDLWVQILAALMVLVLNIPGLIVYLFLRPRETLSEAYERSLEEEALLQEIEEKPTCPGCGQRVQANWQACAYCHTRLKKPCIQCGEMLQLSWDLCPYCATPQTAGATVTTRSHVSREIRARGTNNAPPQTLPDEPPTWSTYDDSRRYDRPATSKDPNSGLEFVDDDY